MAEDSGERRVPTRRMAFEEAFEHVPKRFAGDGDLLGGHITAALSSYFPEGEEFFVRSVRHYRDQITDPSLKQDVRGFIGQEATHGKEHRAFNDYLGALGYGMKRMERGMKYYLRFRERVFPAKSNLAFTAAAEHFTATLAELVLTSEQTRAELGDPAVRDLFVWHALEESEHKAVAFDVYRAVGGGETLRIFTMKVLRVLFAGSIALNVAVSVLGDRDTYRRGVLRPSLRRLRTSPLVSKAVRRQLKEYDRRGFHPNDRDTTALVADWRERLFGQDGSLNDKLAKAKAA